MTPAFYSSPPNNEASQMFTLRRYYALYYGLRPYYYVMVQDLISPMQKLKNSEEKKTNTPFPEIRLKIKM